MRPLFWGLVLTPLVLALCIGYVLARRTLGPTAATRRFRAVLPILLGFMVLGLLLFHFLPRSGSIDGFTFFDFGFVLVLGGFIGYMQYRTRQAGALLLDLGPLQPQRFIRIIGFIMLALAVVSAVVPVVDGDVTVHDASNILFRVAMGSFYVLLATLRTQLREHGLVASGDLLRWHKITGYEWETDRPNTLTLQVNTKVAMVRRPSLPIPPEHRDAVDHILAQYVGHAARA